MQVGMTGGDLEGGRDKDRNANVQALKSLFYQSAESDNATTTANATAAAEIGLLRDIPIARFQFVLLPHQQCAFNIFQPQLVHMYETLLATPEPWYYLHAILPGGAENLGNPEYALPTPVNGDAGPSATLQGTLMRVVAQKRRPDARITLICHGLCRAVVLRGTQALPYSRCDVQMPPDVEQLRAWKRRGAVDARSDVGRGGPVGDRDQVGLLSPSAATLCCSEPKLSSSEACPSIGEPRLLAWALALCEAV